MGILKLFAHTAASFSGVWTTQNMWNKRSDCVYVLTKEKCPHLSNHAVPCPINLLAVFAVGDQVQVVSELDRLGDLLQDVNTETFAAAFDVNP